MKDNIVLGNFWKLYGAGVLHKDITDFEPMSSEQWEQVRRIARRNKLYGVVLDGISHVSEGMKPPRTLIDTWALEMARFTRTHWDNNRVIADLFHRWREAGVRPVLLKGQGYARMYPTPSLRMIGDIDVFVCQSEFDRAMEVVNSLPLDSDEFPDNGKHIEVFYRGKAIELHRRSAEIFHRMDLDPRYQEWSETTLPESKTGFYIDEKGRYADSGTWIATPPPTFNAFYTFMHLWGHIYLGGLHIRSLSDWVILLNTYKEQLNLPELKKRLQQFDLLEPWQIIGYFVVKYMGVDSKDIPFYSEEAARRGKRFGRYLTGELEGFGPLGLSPNLIIRKTCNLRHHLRAWRNRFGIFSYGKSFKELFNMFFTGTICLFKTAK